MPEDRLLVETDAPYLTPQAVRKERNQPAFVAHTLAFIAELRGVERRRSSARRSSATRRACSAGEPRRLSDAPVQPSLRRMRQFGVRPNRELGQNFLVDSNILGVIERAADLRREDVVLEIGGGLGVLSSTWPRAPRTCTWSRSTSACARRWRTRRRRTRT